MTDLTFPTFRDFPAWGVDDMHRLAAALADDRPIAFIGRPGSGKTRLARRIPSILPFDEIEVQNVWLRYGPEGARNKPPRRPPFRAPHHTVTAPALEAETREAIGGVLYLDEFPRLAPEARDVATRLATGDFAHARFVTLVVGLPACPKDCVEGKCRCDTRAVVAYRRELDKILPDVVPFDIEPWNLAEIRRWIVANRRL